MRKQYKHWNPEWNHSPVHSNKIVREFTDKRGEWHCTTEPAVVFEDGRKYWYVHGEDITADVFDWMVDSGVRWPIVDEGEQAAFKLRLL